MTEEPVEVIQADRIFAAKWGLCADDDPFVLDGSNDDWPFLRAVAAHRLSHSAEKQALIEALEKIVSLNQERHWTATGDSPETRWVTRDGPYAKLARSTLLSMRNNGNG